MVGVQRPALAPGALDDGDQAQPKPEAVDEPAPADEPASTEETSIPEAGTEPEGTSNTAPRVTVTQGYYRLFVLSA